MTILIPLPKPTPLLRLKRLLSDVLDPQWRPPRLPLLLMTIAALGVWLGGCTTRTVVQEVPTPIVPPNSLLTSCYVAPPPDEEVLINALEYYPQVSGEWEARFVLMSDAWVEQTQGLETVSYTHLTLPTKRIV